MVGSSILPVTIRNGKLYFLFGKEHSTDATPGFSDFGGGVEPGEDIFETAMREGGEELTGFLGGADEIKKRIKEAGGHLKIKYLFPEQKNSSYNIHVFYIDYDENLPKYYNANHKFLWENMNKKLLKSTKLFEKVEIEWFSIDDIKKRRSEFRSFYQEITDLILTKQNKIIDFIKSKKDYRKTIKKRTRRSNKNAFGDSLPV